MRRQIYKKITKELTEISEKDSILLKIVPENYQKRGCKLSIDSFHP
ncbi:hypothetical protein Bache_2631 [Bacteroides helcogenes P 36-108]|uniref:Uncharacterized protein n=1 Tax=Bacteroides helcogenes (strain ATCC 35417 / DSM 20613 / JCM 6297 / CCUG 15421 / P 36-108) TaxID=693979 RepID=E6SWC4_BACT6|nr:hypothetical protein Bache_2631 [Bacteroides helcogenes P 36-108]